nr:hypothetical protein [Tanacetum cinerariifolium]
VGLAEIDVFILLISASTPVISSELVGTPRMSSNLFLELGELTVGMENSTVSVSICSAEGLNVEEVELGFPLPSGT